MTNNAKAVAEALRVYAACAEDDFDSVDGYTIAYDMEVLADALESGREITLDYLLEELYIEAQGGSYKWK